MSAVLNNSPAGFGEQYELAQQLAAQYHTTPYSDRPYVEHLAIVVQTLRQFGFVPGDSAGAEHSRISERLLIAAYLHQAPVNTDLTVERIREQFGDEVADLVTAVMDEPGTTRQERNERTYSKTRAHPDAVILMLASWIADLGSSLRGSARRDSDRAGCYVEDYPLFHDALYVPGQADEMWAYLDRLIEQSLPVDVEYVA